MVGININCRRQDFIDEILSYLKTIETRNRDTLKSFVGQRVGLIKTGCGKAMLMGYATISGKIVYDSPEAFRADYQKHRVKAGSIYDIKDKKYGYILTDVMRCEPLEVTSKGIVFRNI